MTLPAVAVVASPRGGGGVALDPDPPVGGDARRCVSPPPPPCARAPPSASSARWGAHWVPPGICCFERSARKRGKFTIDVDLSQT